MRDIGFSNGVTHKLLDNPHSKINLELFYASGATAIEINFHSEKDRHDIFACDGLMQHFPKRSIHLPCDVRYNLEMDLDILEKAASFYEKNACELAVVHPDLVDDWKVFKDFPFSLAAENMDSRKKNFKTSEDMAELFCKQPELGFVLDLGHCMDTCPDMSEAAKMIGQLSPLIKEIHLSAYVSFHDPLYRSEQDEIIYLCRLTNAPIIIESVLSKKDGFEGINKEINYIRKRL